VPDVPPKTLMINRGWGCLASGEPAIKHRVLDMGCVVLIDGQGNTLGDEKIRPDVVKKKIGKGE
jgi:hypothetical protein